MKDGRIPALTPFWESVSVPGIYFAGNATQGARGIGKRGLGASSSSVNGFRYNARVLAYHLAQRLGMRVTRLRLPPHEIVPFVLHELSHAPELWIQKGYLARVLTFADGVNDQGILPVSHFLDESGPDALAAAIGGPVGHDLSDRSPPAVRGDQGASAAGSPVARVRGRVVHRRSRIDPPLAD